MSPGLREPGDDPFAEWLAALAEGHGAATAPAPSRERTPPPELQQRLDRGLACIQLLRDVLPPRTKAKVAPTPSADGVPSCVGRFAILRKLGQGAFGIVFL